MRRSPIYSLFIKSNQIKSSQINLGATNTPSGLLIVRIRRPATWTHATDPHVCNRNNNTATVQGDSYIDDSTPHHARCRPRRPPPYNQKPGKLEQRTALRKRQLPPGSKVKPGLTRRDRKAAVGKLTNTSTHRQHDPSPLEYLKTESQPRIASTGGRLFG